MIRYLEMINYIRIIILEFSHELSLRSINSCILSYSSCVGWTNSVMIETDEIQADGIIYEKTVILASITLKIIVTTARYW